MQKGDTLVTYDTQEYDRSLEQAQLQAKAAKAGYAGSAAQSKEMTQAYEEAQAQESMYQQAYEAALENVNDLQYNIETVADAVDDKRDKINQDIAQVEIEIAQKNAQAADYDDEDRLDYLEEAAQLQVKLASLKKKLLELPDSGAKPIEDRYFNEAQYYLNDPDWYTQSIGIWQEEDYLALYVLWHCNQFPGKYCGGGTGVFVSATAFPAKYECILHPAQLGDTDVSKDLLCNCTGDSSLNTGQLPCMP